MTDDTDAGVREIPVDELVLDAKNPRLPEDLDETDQENLIGYMVAEYDVLTVARSIAEHGYFPSEPVIVVMENDQPIVVEGNRRVAAVKLLRSAELREAVDVEYPEEWALLAKNNKAPDAIPSVVAPDRPSVAPIIGYRHISGIEPWDPWAKARFMARLVREENLSFEEVGRLVGEKATDVRAHYRNHAIVRQAREDFEIVTERVEQSFGVFTRAMTSLGVRDFIGAPAPSEVVRGKPPVPKQRAAATRELLVWLFGDEDSEPVISDSRHITELGTIVASETGTTVLRETGDREEAFIAAGGLRDRLMKRLGNARGNLEKANTDIENHQGDEEVCAELAGCRQALDLLLEGAECDD